MNKFVCIHGHFYQPPRENPWLEEVELQESAYPFHDWNERISAECYARNGASRILDGEGRIIEIVNNYSRISFNIGPTLLSWMEKKDPDAYQSVLEADRLGRERFSGHGPAMAQVYNHIIMPLANSRDKRTQVLWGIKDFEARFKRLPEGMWLAEAAVDLESLDIMAEYGIKFTVLAPHQAKRAKKISLKRSWDAQDEEAIDLRRPYLCRLPSGRTITIFFYDGPISQSIAFEGLLHSGVALGNRIVGAFDRKTMKNQMVHIATDGESYGHHHKFGDMALAYCLQHIERNNLAHITVYGEYLEFNPPEYEVEIIENSSWSCIHGVERWRDNCGCNSGGKQGWHQEWRAPLRAALDWLRDRSAEVFEKEMQAFTQDVWAARNAYVSVIFDRTPETIEKYLAAYLREGLSAEEKNRALRCLEIQRNALLMYTSCGWFFDDVSGLETVQIIKYAARVIQLVQRVCQEDLELGFIERLGKAKSNVPEANNGARIYKIYVEPSIVDILRVGAHYAMSALYQEYSDQARLYCFDVYRKSVDRQAIGKMEIMVGRAEIVSEVTWTRFEVEFLVLHLGDHNFITGVKYFSDEDSFQKMRLEAMDAFRDGDIPRSLQVINRYFGQKSYSLWHLFKHEQQTILEQIFASTMLEVETSFRRIYEDHFSLIRMINENHMPLPKTLSRVVEFVVHRDLTRILEMPNIPVDKLEEMVLEVTSWPFKRDKESLDHVGARRIHEMMRAFAENPHDVDLLEQISEVAAILEDLKLDMDPWKSQNIYYSVARMLYLKKREQAATWPEAERWVIAFENLGRILGVRPLVES